MGVGVQPVALGVKAESSFQCNIAYRASQVKPRHGWGAAKCSGLSSRVGVTDPNVHRAQEESRGAVTYKYPTH